MSYFLLLAVLFKLSLLLLVLHSCSIIIFFDSSGIGFHRSFVLQVHAYIISHLRGQMPSLFGKDTKKKELIASLGDVFAQLQRQHQISPGDFPNVKHMQEQLQFHDFSKFQLLKPKLIESVDKMLAEEIAKLMARIPREEHDKKENSAVKGGAFEGYKESPFGIGKGEGIDRGNDQVEWIVGQEQYKYDEAFAALNPVNGKITGAAAKAEMVKSRLPNAILGKVWKLADIDKDGMLDSDEFALAMHLISVKLEGHDLPNELPQHLIPPSKR